MFCNLELLPLGGSLFFPIFLSLIFLSNVFFPLWPSALKIFLPPFFCLLFPCCFPTWAALRLRNCYESVTLGHRLDAEMLADALTTSNSFIGRRAFLLACLKNSIAALASLESLHSHGRVWSPGFSR